MYTKPGPGGGKSELTQRPQLSNERGGKWLRIADGAGCVASGELQTFAQLRFPVLVKMGPKVQ